MARSICANYDGIAPLRGRPASRPDKANQIKQSNPQANEVRFVITASELHARKKRRRKKHNAKF